MSLALEEKFGYFTFAFCSEHAYAIVVYVYIVLQSIIHLQRSQDLNIRKTCKKYGSMERTYMYAALAPSVFTLHAQW